MRLNKLGELALFNTIVLLALAFFWIFAPLLLPAILLFVAVILIVVNGVFYVVALYQWFFKRGD